MSKFLSLVKNKKGAALMTAIAFMTIAVALCAIITTFILAMARTSSSYTSVNENKIVADQIASDFLRNYTDNAYTFNPTSYDGYTVYVEGNSSTFTCTAYKKDSSSPLITVVVTYDSTYKFTKYEYGNI